MAVGRTLKILEHSLKTISRSHTISSLQKVPILSHKPLRMGVQPEHKLFNKTLVIFECKSNLRYKDKDCMTDVTLIRSISVLHVENSVLTLFFTGR